jgi:hypothetical protein
MQCPSCGHQNRSDARFCDRCGATLAQGNQAATVPQSSQFNTQNAGPGGVGWRSSATINQLPHTSMPQQSASSMPLSTDTTPPIQPGGHGGIVGIARGIQQRQGLSTSTGLQETILTFRLERYDGGGNRTRVVPVEIRGLSITGFISEGDQVEVFGKAKDGLVRVKHVRNLTTNGSMRAKGISTTVKILWAILFLLFLAVAIFIISLIILTPHP